MDLFTYALQRKKIIAISEIINNLQSFDTLVLNELPDVGQTGILYFVPATDALEMDNYDEFIYTNNSWERIGSTKVDLTNYATKDEVAQVRTYKTFSTSWTAKATSSYTTKQLCDVINADPNAVEGMVYLGEIRCSDLSSLSGGVNLVNGEAVVEIIKGTGTSGKVIHISLTSGNRTPFRWEYTYWNNGSNVSGWRGFYPIQDNGIPKTDLSAEVQELLDSVEDLHDYEIFATSNNEQIQLSDGSMFRAAIEGRR